MDIARDTVVRRDAAPNAAGQRDAEVDASGSTPRRSGGAGEEPASAGKPTSAGGSSTAEGSSPPGGAARPPDLPPARPTISQFIDEVRAALAARFYLFELEAKRAASSAAYMLALAVGAALLGVTAWLLLIGAVVYGAVSGGVPWVLAVTVAIALHAVAVFLLVRAIRAKAESLTFAATRRTLSKENSSSAHHGSGV